MQLIYGWAAVMRNGERKSWLDGEGEKQERKDSWVMMGLWWYWAPIFQMKQEAWSDIVYLSPFVILLFKKKKKKQHKNQTFRICLSFRQQTTVFFPSFFIWLFLAHSAATLGPEQRFVVCSPTKGDTFQQLCDLGGWPEHMPFESLLKESWGHAALLRVSRWKKKKKSRGEKFPFNTAVFGLGLVPSQSTWWLNLPWCIGKASQ